MGRAGKIVAGTSSYGKRLPASFRVRAVSLTILMLAWMLGTQVPRATAQSFGLNAANPDSVLSDQLDKIPGEPLTLADAVRSAIEGGSTLAQRAAAEVVAARGAHMREKGHFDPELFFDGNTGEMDQVRTSPFETNDVISTRTSTGSGGLRTLLPLGTELEASMDALRTESNSDFTTVNPSYSAAGRLSIRQPLLRGFGPGTSSEATATGREQKA